MPILKRTIIGLILIIGLTVQASFVHAIYSPTISQRAASIRQNVLSARTQNGTGSLQAARQHLIEEDKAARDEGRETGVPAKAAKALGKILGIMFWETIRHPFDSIFMIFNLTSTSKTKQILPDTAISVCLRNDIWMLQDLRDVVAQEMVKSYMMADTYHGDLLENDYDYLTDHIRYLKDYGNNSKESGKYLFGIYRF